MLFVWRWLSGSPSSRKIFSPGGRQFEQSEVDYPQLQFVAKAESMPPSGAPYTFNQALVLPSRFPYFPMRSWQDSPSGINSIDQRSVAGRHRQLIPRFTSVHASHLIAPLPHSDNPVSHPTRCPLLPGLTGSLASRPPYIIRRQHCFCIKFVASRQAHAPTCPTPTYPHHSQKLPDPGHCQPFSRYLIPLQR